MIKINFNLDQNHSIECNFSLFSGLEIYRLNGKEIHRVRRFKANAKTLLNVKTGSTDKNVRIQFKFRPWRRFFKAILTDAEVYVDDKLFIQNLMEEPYWKKSLFTKSFETLSILIMFLLVVVFISAVYFNELFPQAESVEVLNAALATSECRGAIPGTDQSYILSVSRAIDLRQEEMKRKQRWVSDGGRSVFSIITQDFKHAPKPCQESRLELFDQYLKNGANINKVRSNFKQLTILQDAVLSVDLPLTCELLKRGASTEVLVLAYHLDGTASNITGLSTYQLPSFLYSKNADPLYLEIVEMFDRFKNQQVCN